MQNHLSFRKYQQRVDQWIESVGSEYFPPITNMCLLAEEVGEICRLVSRGYGEQQFKPGERPVDLKLAIADELADALFILACVANDLDISLSDAVEQNFQKKNARDINRYRIMRCL